MVEPGGRAVTRPESRRRIDKIGQLTLLLQQATFDPLVEFSQFGRAVGKASNAIDFIRRGLPDFRQPIPSQIWERHIVEKHVDWISFISSDRGLHTSRTDI